MTVLTRQSSNHSFPPSVTVKPVDYDSLDSLVNVLKGQDAIVSTLGSLVIATQLRLVEAASKAGVKRFIPSEFGSNLSNSKTRALPVYKDKVTVQDALAKEAAAGSLSYTLIYNGPFLDWGLAVGFVLSVKGKSVTYFDGGENVVSTTSLPTIGKAVAGVYVQDTATTLKALAAKAKKATGEEGWNEETQSVDGLLETAWAELGKPQPNPDNFAYNFLRAGIWGEGYGAHYEKLDNELLGIEGKSEEEVQELVNGLAK